MLLTSDGCQRSGSYDAKEVTLRQALPWGLEAAAAPTPPQRGNATTGRIGAVFPEIDHQGAP